MDVDGHLGERVSAEHLQRGQPGGKHVHHQAGSPRCHGGAGHLQHLVGTAGNVRAVDDPLPGVVFHPAQRARDRADPRQERAIRRVVHFLVILDEMHPAARGGFAARGHLIGSEPGAGLDDPAEQQRLRPQAQQRPRPRDAKPGAVECGEEAVGEDDVGKPDDVGERPFKERAGQQIQPDGGEGGAPLGQIRHRVGDGGVAAARRELVHIMHTPQRSRIQRGRRTPPRPRACTLLQGDEFRGPVQVVARLEVVDAEKRVGYRAPLRHIWFDVIWHA